MVRRLLQGSLASSALWASTAGAIPIDFQISGATSSAAGFAAGSTVSITPSSEVTSPFSLNLDGPPGAESHTFDFLDISVGGSGLVAGVIQASLSFTDPVVGSASGLFVGLSVILDHVAGGTVTVISNPAPIAFGDGGLFGVTFQGFGARCYSCEALTGTVTATVTLLEAPRAVPEPATLSLLGAGLGAFAFASRRRRKA